MEPAKIAYRIGEATEVSGLGRTTIYRLINDGEIAAVHVGRRILILHASLAAYLEGLQSAGATTPDSRPGVTRQRQPEAPKAVATNT